MDKLLGALRACMTSKSPAVVAAAMDSLANSMRLFEANMGVKRQRDAIMGDVVKGVKSGQADVMEKSLQVLVVICDDYYRSVGRPVVRVVRAFGPSFGGWAGRQPGRLGDHDCLPWCIAAR